MSAQDFLTSFTNSFMFGMLTGMPSYGCYNPFYSPYMTMPSLFMNPMYSMPYTYTSTFMPMPMPMPMLYSQPTFTFTNQNYNLNTWNNTSNNWSNSSNWNWNWNFSNTTQNLSTQTSSDKSNLSNTSNSSNIKSNKNEPICYDAEKIKEKWSNKKSGLSNEFYNKVVNISKKIQCDPNDLMAVMYSESELSTTARNKKSGATGLIQFMPKTAKHFGTTIDELKRMSPEKQLDYVEKYLENNISSAGISGRIDRGTLYALVFLPGRANRETLTTSGEKYYQQNKGLDADKDGKITKSELHNRLTSYMA